MAKRKSFMAPLAPRAMAILSAVAMLSTSSVVLPVNAETAPKAQVSGDTSGNQTNTISTTSTKCTGNKQLSGTDAQIFSQIVPENDGDIICVQSDGFKTEITGESDIQNYHWVTWYKEHLDDDIDKTLSLGNYRGFAASKVEQWKEYEDEIRALNNGAFPEIKDYTYPTDTTDGTLDFWGDIAGYYDILGDPQYSNIHLESYQQFSYAVQHITTRTERVENPDYKAPSTGGGGGSGGVAGGGSSRKLPYPSRINNNAMIGISFIEFHVQ